MNIIKMLSREYRRRAAADKAWQAVYDRVSAAKAGVR